MIIKSLNIAPCNISSCVRPHFNIWIHWPKWGSHRLLEKLLLVFWGFWSFIASFLKNNLWLLWNIFATLSVLINGLWINDLFYRLWIFSWQPFISGVLNRQCTGSLLSEVISDHRRVFLGLLLDCLELDLGQLLIHFLLYHVVLFCDLKSFLRNLVLHLHAFKARDRWPFIFHRFHI